MCCLRHPEHHARNRTSLAGLEQDLLFFGPPYIRFLFERWVSFGLVLIHENIHILDPQIIHVYDFWNTNENNSKTTWIS